MNHRVLVPTTVLAVVSATLGACTGLPGPRPTDSSPTVVDQPTPVPTPRPSPPPSLDDLARRAQPAVVRITETTCAGGGSGSGFLIDATHVVTVAHVVADAQAVTVRRPDGKVSRATVVGTDPQREVALLELQKPLKTSRTLSFDARPVDVLDEVAALGYPLGGPLSVTKGAVNGLHRRIDVKDGPTVSGLLQFNADINPGDSGGPLLGASGRVVGLIEAETDGANGLYYAVPSTVAAGLVNAWSSSPDEPAVPACGESYSSVDVTSIHPDAPSIALALGAFVTGVNVGTERLTLADGSTIEGYELAARRLTGTLRTRWGRDATSLASTFQRITIDHVELVKADNPGALEDTADVRWQLHQSADDAGAGAGCAIVDLRLTLRLDSGDWKLDKVRQLGDGADC